MQSSKNNLKLLIAQNRIEEAIDILLKQTNLYLSENKDDKIITKICDALLINSGKLNGLIHDQNLGILSSEEAKITKAEVQKAILYVIDQLPETVLEFEKYSDSKTDISGTEQSRLRECVKLLKETQSDFEFDIFLSFSSKDRDEARKIWEKLRGYGLQVFLSDEALKIDIGTSFTDKIQYALRNSRHLVLLCTPDAMQSNYVKIETDAFFNQFFIKSQVGQRRLIILKGKGFEMDQLPLFYQSLQLAESVELIIHALVNKTIIEQKEIEKNQQDEELKMRKKMEEIEYLKQLEREALEAKALEEFERLKKEEQQRLEKERELRQIQLAEEKERKEKEEKERKTAEENERLKREKEQRERLEKENEIKERQAAKERKEKEEREIAIAEEKKRQEQELRIRQADWDKCREINALFAYETFISNYKDGLYIEEAKAEIEKIKAVQKQKETEERERIEQERIEKERELKQKQVAEAKERQEKEEKERKTAEENERLKKEERERLEKENELKGRQVAKESQEQEELEIKAMDINNREKENMSLNKTQINETGHTIYSIIVSTIIPVTLLFIFPVTVDKSESENWHLNGGFNYIINNLLIAIFAIISSWLISWRKLISRNFFLTSLLFGTIITIVISFIISTDLYAISGWESIAFNNLIVGSVIGLAFALFCVNKIN